MSDTESLPRSIFHKLSSVLWVLAVLAIVVLAVYVSLGRLLSTNLQAYQKEVLAELNARVPFEIEAGGLSGEWHSFTPEIVLTDLRLRLPESGGDTLELSGGRIGLDVLDSLATRSMQFTSVQLESLELQGELTADGRLVLPGLTGGGGAIDDWLREALLNIEYVTLSQNTLRLSLPNGEQRQYDANLHLAREGSERALTVELVSTGGARIHAVGRGVGDPFSPEQFVGNLYVRMDSSDLDAVRGMLAQEPAVWMEGSLDTQWWVSWNRGALDLDMQVQIEDALLQPNEGEWSVPLDGLSMSASLVEKRNRWTVYAADIVAERGETRVELPRLQLDLWDEALRLRTGNLQLAPLNELILGLDTLPEAVQGVFEVLQPQGNVSALQVAVSDVARPLDDWDVEANFEDVVVQSWKGAPGVTSANGYLQMSQAGGYVVIDSQQFTMDFPVLYKQPLFYDDFFGTLYLSWDEDALVLDSGPITATAVEGTATALFRLNIPFQPTEPGLEMDLMVGLENSHPIHRVKYLPYVLNHNLLDWLANSVGDGDVEQAAFIWRGSLRKGASPLRTVQLFLNIANTSLDYHPQWPKVREIDGVVLIDDTSVSVWADSARIYDSTLERLSVEAWMNEQQHMQLAVEGSLRGSAADGLAIVNDSLLGEMVGGVFDQWQAAGELEAQLQLLLDLTDKSVPPQVDVRANFASVSLDIEPGKLPLEEFGGELYYSSVGGFSSSGLQGKLWGEAVAAVVRQRPLGHDRGSMTLGNSAVEIELATFMEMGSVQNWLGLEALQLASGRTRLEGMVELRPGEEPRLLLTSHLQGVSLDLPSPWGKDAESEVPFNLQLPLAGGISELDMQLGTDLDLRLDVAGGSFHGAALGLSTAAPELVDNVVRVIGSSSLVDVQEWQQFIDRYLLATATVIAQTKASAPQADGGQAAADIAAAAPDLRIQVDDIHADRVMLWGREFEDVRFSLAVDPDAWQVRAETDWLQGSYFQPRQGRAGLKLDFLELDGLANAPLQPGTESGEAGALEVPSMQVVVSRIQRNGTPLGTLQFSLESNGDVVQAQNIHGELAGMKLLPDQPASLDWDQGAETRLAADLHFDDFGQTLDQLGYPRFLETQQGVLKLDLEWPGSPQGFQLGEASGSLVIDVQRGRFLETPAGATGALKVVSILNLAEVVSRLSLTHMFESGVPFTTMEGEAYLHAGTIEVPTMQVRGSSSSFAFTALSDISQRSLEGELVATLPVANNLPWVAALAGGLPVAAGVFVVSKVFEKQVNRLSSGVYSISGTWDEPTVTFSRIFDDAARQDSMAGGVPEEGQSSGTLVERQASGLGLERVPEQDQDPQQEQEQEQVGEARAVPDPNGSGQSEPP